MISAFRKPEKNHQTQSNVSHTPVHMPNVKNEAQFLTLSQCFNGVSPNSPIIALPSGMMMHQHPITSGCSSNQQHVPEQIQQYFILNQNYAPTSSFDQNTHQFVCPVVFLHGNEHQGIQPINLSANVFLQREPEQDSPMNLEDDRCAAQCYNKISGHFYNLPPSNESLLELQLIQEAARALFNASKIAKEKVLPLNLPRERTNLDQKFDRNLNSCLGLEKVDFSNNRQQSEIQDVSLHNQEKSKAETLIQDKLTVSKIQQNQKDEKKCFSIGNIRRSPSIISTQCESQKRESPMNQQILADISSQGSSDTQSLGEEIKDMKEANHFTNRRKQGTAQKLRPSMFSQLDLTTKGRSFNRNNNFLTQTSVSRIQNGSFYLNDVLILEKILDSDNLNECVQIILNKDRTVTITQAKIEKQGSQSFQTLNFKGQQFSNIQKESQSISDRQISPHKSEGLSLSAQDATSKDCIQSKCDLGLPVSLTKTTCVSQGLGNISQLVLTRERLSSNQDSNCQQPEIKEEKQHQSQDFKTQNKTHLSNRLGRRGPYKKVGASLIDMRGCNFKNEKDQNRGHGGSGFNRKTLKVVGQHSARTKLSTYSKESSLMINRQKSDSSWQDSVNSADNLNSRRQRQRKNDEQHNFLMNEFLKNPNWDKDTLQRLSDELGLKMSQIYKWNWDQQKKIRDTSMTPQFPHSQLTNVIQNANPSNFI